MSSMLRRSTLAAANGITPVDIAIMKAMCDGVPKRTIAKGLHMSRRDLYAAYWQLLKKIPSRTKCGMIYKAAKMGVLY